MSKNLKPVKEGAKVKQEERVPVPCDRSVSDMSSWSKANHSASIKEDTREVWVGQGISQLWKVIYRQAKDFWPLF